MKILKEPSLISVQYRRRQILKTLRVPSVNAFFDLYTGDTILFKCGAKDIRALKPKVKGFSSRLKLESSTFRHQ